MAQTDEKNTREEGSITGDGSLDAVEKNDFREDMWAHQQDDWSNRGKSKSDMNDKKSR